MAPAPIIDNTQARIDRLEQRIRSLHVSDGVIGWDGYDDLPVAALPVEFRMPDIERYTGIGCPRIHLQLYSTVMRGHRLDEAQMIMLFPLSLSGAAQRWFASLDPSRHRTWADLGQEFIRQYSFNTVVDVSRRELEALRQRPDESVTSFICAIFSLQREMNEVTDSSGLCLRASNSLRDTSTTVLKEYCLINSCPKSAHVLRLEGSNDANQR